MKQAPSIYLIGRSDLRAYAEAALSEQAINFSSVGALEECGSGNLVVDFQSGWNPSRAKEQYEFCETYKVPVLSTRLDGMYGYIGPRMTPEKDGCPYCAELRHGAITQSDFYESASSPRTVSFLNLKPFVELLCSALMLSLKDFAEGRSHQAIYVLNGSNLEGHWHSVVPASYCPVCGSLPTDDAASAAIRLAARPKRSPTDDRAIPTFELSSVELREQFFDWRFGLFSHIYRVLNAPLALTAVEMPLAKQRSSESGWGRSKDYVESERLAFFEALERHAGMTPRSKRTCVRGSYQQLKSNALNPLSFGEHHPDCVAHPDSWLVPFSPNLTLSWVWSYSFKHRKPMLIPEQLAYYSMSITPDAERAFYETSNGCAQGGNLEEAVLYGLFEVFERDAFLMTWYGQLPVPKLTLGEKTPPDIYYLAEKISLKGYKLTLFNTTNDFGVPAIWALAVNQKGKTPSTFTAAGAHPDPYKAIHAALTELTTSVYVHERDEKRYTEAFLIEMLQNPYKVATLEDHVELYTMSEAYQRFAFIDQSDQNSLNVEVAFPGWRERWHQENLTTYLETTIEHILGLGLDVVVVNQTTREQRDIGLACVKVLIPGALTMTFGHLRHRTLGLPRLLEVPAELGFWSKPKTYANLDITPHPFP